VGTASQQFPYRDEEDGRRLSAVEATRRREEKEEG
jgi:hypothetical protein